MRKLADLCYNIPETPIYGELTDRSVRKMGRLFIDLMESGSTLRICDLGSGGGVMLVSLHRYLQQFDVPHVLHGIEGSPQRVRISKTILSQEIVSTTPWSISQEDLEIKSNLPRGTTHTISFDSTFPEKTMQNIKRMQRNCSTLQFVVTTHKYNDTSFKLVQTISCVMHGSGSRIQFYCYKLK